jgi:hypothetical protein
MFCPFSTDFYKDRLTDAQLEELEFPKATKSPKTKGTPAARRRPSRPPKKIVVEEEDDE